MVSVARYTVCMLVALVLLGVPVLPVTQAQPASNQAVEDLIGVAQSYMRHKQWDFASYEWRMVLNRDPKNRTAHLGLAEALMKSGLVADAITLLEKARAETPHPQLDVKLATAYTVEGNPEKAADVLQGTLNKYPLDLSAMMALKQMASRLPEARRAAVNKQLAEQTRTAKAKAKAAMQAARYADAARYFEVVAKTSGTVGGVNDYALATLLAGNVRGAAAEFERIKRKSRCLVKSNVAVSFLGVGKTSEAQRLMESVIGECHDPAMQPKFYNNLGFIYETSRKWTRSRYAYERALDLDPALTKALRNLGFAYQRERDYAGAIALYKRHLQQNPMDGAVWNQMGFVYELMREPKLAMTAYIRAISATPDLQDAYYNLGILYKKQGKLEAANAMFKQMTEREFDALERSKDAANTKAGVSPILDVVDLFFSEPLESGG